MENPATGSHPGGILSGREAIMAATPQPGWQASLRGLKAETKQSLVKMWVHKHFGLLMLFILALLFISYYLGSGVSDTVTASEFALKKNGDKKAQSVEKESTWEMVLGLFSPTTCIIKENQEVKPCKLRKYLNETECLKFKCCFTSSGTSNLNCFTPIRDKPTQMLRMFGLGVISIVVLGCLPIYCCSLWQRSRWANPLRRKVNRMLKGLKKQRSKLKTDAEMFGIVMEEDEGDEREQETKALFSQ